MGSSLGCCSGALRPFHPSVVTPWRPPAQRGSFVLSNPCFLVLVGIVRLRDGLRDRYPVEDYLDLFDLAAHQIHQGLQASAAKEPSKMNRIIIGMASVELLPWARPGFTAPASICMTFALSC